MTTNKEFRKTFFKKNTLTSLVEIDEFFEKGRIRVGFRKYDKNAEKGHRVTEAIDVFFTIPEALILSNFILEGWADKMLAKKSPFIYKNTIGGYGEGEDVRYRRMDIIPSSKGDYALSAGEGKGKRDDKGLIQPVSKPDKRIIIPFNSAELKYFARTLKEAALSYDVFNIRKAHRAKKSAQFARFDASTSFVEVSEAFNIGKIRVGFRQYDKETKRQTKAIDIFMSMEEADKLIHLITSGALYEASKAVSNVYNPIWESTMGGYNTKEGVVRYRKMTVHAGKKAEFALFANEGNGKRDDKGLIQPVSKADKSVSIPITKRGFRAFSDALNRAITLYHLTETLNWVMKK